MYGMYGDGDGYAASRANLVVMNGQAVERMDGLRLSSSEVKRSSKSQRSYNI